MDNLGEWELSRHKAARKSQKLTNYGMFYYTVSE